MSSIITNTIDIHYPVAGVDNDSKGFRDNFSRIQTALSQAKTEISWLEANAVLRQPVSETGVATNDLKEGLIVNGHYNKFYGTMHSTTVTAATVNISLENGIFQKISLAEDTAVTFSGWPATGLYANIRVHITASSSTPITITSIASSGNGLVIQEAGFPALNDISNLDYHSFEAYSYDNGTTVFVNYLGRYSIPVN